MPTSLTLDTARRDDGEVVLVAAGEIDLSNIEAFSQAVTAATTEAGSDDGTLTVDLRGVEYLDSAAISVLFARADQIRLIAHPLLMSILNVSGLTQLVAVEAVPPAAEN